MLNLRIELLLLDLGFNISINTKSINNSNGSTLIFIAGSILSLVVVIEELY